MSRCLIAIAAAFWLACGGPQEQSRAPTEAKIEPPDVELLPAGIYWYGYKTCEGCSKPAAVTAAQALTIEDARALVKSAPDFLAPGYPLVVHADQIKSTAVAGILVIYGIHAADADAARWKTYLSLRGFKSDRFVIEGDDTPPMKESPKVVVQTVAGAPAQAYDAGEVEEAERAAYQSQQWLRPEQIAAKLKPACAIEPGSIFVAAETELEWYRWAPVRCGETEALINWRQSRLGNAVIVRQRDGYVMRQVTAVECDSPTFQEWRWGETGRGAKSGAAKSPAGC